MNFKEAKTKLLRILDDLGIEAGDTVHLAADMGAIPLPRIDAPVERDAIQQRERDWCHFVLETIFERLGPNGTLLMGAAFLPYARDGVPYVHEESPSHASPLAEHLRTYPGSLRSFHPMLSVVGYGKHASDILDNVGRSGFGIRSPYARFPRYETKFVFLGVGGSLRALTYGYHLQQLYGVNHMFNKVFNIPAYKEGKKYPGPWLCFVRFLEAGIVRDFSRLAKRLHQAGAKKTSSIFPRPMECMRVEDVDRIGFELLDENPYAFIEKPVEVHFDPPFGAPEDGDVTSIYYARSNRLPAK